MTEYSDPPMTEEEEAVYQQLRREYLIEAPARLGELRKDLAAARAGEPDALASLKSRFHKLSGSGGSYGFPAISDAGRTGEAWLAEHSEADDQGFARLGAIIGRVAAAFDDAARELGYPAAPQRAPPFGWRAHLVGGDGDLATVLATTLRDAKFTVTSASLDADPADIPVSERPEIVVLVPAPQEDPRSALARWTAGPFEGYLAIALIAEPDQVDLLREPYARVDLFAEPARAEVEVPRWARGVARAAATPVSVLLVLPEEAERAAASSWLESAGVRVTTALSAEAALETLREETPDLLLIDWGLPNCEGAALVRLLRRSPQLALTPLLGLASFDTDTERERALAAGADELILRPLGQSRLVAAVIHRARRARRLDEAVRRDSLTGLLTDGTLADELEQILAHARRSGEKVSFALLDVDHFRRLNEQLGPKVGDLVLAHLARAIRERVRVSDLVVRMGGEEFGVLFRQCGPADARGITNEIRSELVSAPPLVEGTALPIRVSVGIAAFPDHASGVRDLILAAERALREAKETGRDKVVVTGDRGPVTSDR